MTKESGQSHEDPRFADRREEFECEECRKWTGKPLVPIRQATELLRSQGAKGFKLSHGCHYRKDEKGKLHHIPMTVLETADGKVIEYIPELP